MTVKHTANRPAKQAPAQSASRARYSLRGGFEGNHRAPEVLIPNVDLKTMLEIIEDHLALARHKEVMAKLDSTDLIPLAVVKARLAGESLIKAWRNERGLTLVALAQASGLSQPFLSQLERGQKETTTTTLKKLAAALDVEPGDLI
jgi:DNA-binding Xre family transcriptional regulator